MELHGRLLTFALCLLFYVDYSSSNPILVFTNAANLAVGANQQGGSAQTVIRVLADAEQGDAMAQLLLGLWHRTGQGVPLDNAKAYIWLFLSASAEGKQKEEAAKWLEEVAKQMTPQQIEQARRLAAEWKPKPAAAGSNTGMGAGEGAVVGPTPYGINSNITSPVALSQPIPPYTKEASDAHIEGTVTLQCVMREDGSVNVIKVIRGLGYGLDESAVKTISEKWRFKPGTRNGEPIDVNANIEVHFVYYPLK